MNSRRSVPFSGSSLLRFGRALLLPLLLLCVQQGAFLHELSHYKAGETQDEGDRRPANGPCALCLAFADVQSVATPAVPPLLLLARLSFVLVPVAVVIARAATPPPRRSRGPPAHR
ncbi:MAG: DUF2946 family protein [Rubrivivax sp.]